MFVYELCTAPNRYDSVHRTKLICLCSPQHQTDMLVITAPDMFVLTSPPNIHNTKPIRLRSQYQNRYNCLCSDDIFVIIGSDQTNIFVITTPNHTIVFAVPAPTEAITANRYVCDHNTTPIRLYLQRPNQ